MGYLEPGDGVATEVVSRALELAARRIATTIAERRAEIEDLFGASERLQALLDDWLANGVDTNRVVIVPATQLPGARAFYAGSRDTIFVSDAMLDPAVPIEALVDVLVEELGHRIDATANSTDTPGDEGHAFAAVTRGEPVGVIATDDHATITLADGNVIAVETTVSVSDSGGFEGSNQTLTLESTAGGTITYFYEHFSIPDRFIIRYEGRTLFDTGFVGGSRSGTIELPAGTSNQLSVIIATDNTGTAWNYTVSVDPSECADVEPWIIRALGNPFEHDEQTDFCITSGTVEIGRLDGAATLIRAVGSSKAEYNENQARIFGATIFSGIGGIQTSLFSADIDLNLRTGAASLDNVQPGTFKLAGLDIEFRSMTILSDTLAFDVRFQLPSAVSGLLIDTIDFFDDALRITSNGAAPVLGFKIDPPGSKSFKLLDVIDVEASKMSIEYRAAEDALRFQGKISFTNTKFAKTGPGIGKVEADLSGENYLQISSDLDPQLVGALRIDGEVPLARGWSVKGLELTIDTVARTIGGSATLGTPFGMKFGEGAEAKASVEFTYSPFQLDKIGLTLDNLNKPIPAYPAFYFQSIGGSIDNFAPSNPNDVKGTFTIAATLGPQIGGTRLARAQFDAEVSEKSFQGTITTDILTANFRYFGADLGTFTLVKDTSVATLDWSKGTFTFQGTSNILDGLFVTTGTFTANSDFDFGFARTGTLSIPDFVPVYGGTQIANGNLAVSFSSDGNLSNDYAAAWGQYSIATPWDTYTITLGLRVGFDGTITSIGAGNIPKVSSWFIEGGQGFVVLSASWVTADPGARVFVTMPDGTVIQEADFAAHKIMIVEALSSDTTRAVVIDAPIEGIWDLELVDEAGRGEITYQASGQVELSEFEFTGAPTALGGGVFEFAFDANVTGAAATATFYYDDDLSTYDGIEAGSMQIADGDGIFSWNSLGVVPGEYYLYAMVDDGTGPIVIGGTSQTVTAGAAADVAVTIGASVTEALAGDTIRYTVTATNLSLTTMAAGITALVTLPELASVIASSIAGASSDFADLAFDLGALAAGASTSFTIDARVDMAAKLGDALSTGVYIVTDSYDPETLNDTAGIQLRVREATAPAGTVDLIVDSALADGTPPVAGQSFSYTVTVENRGTATATNVQLSEFATNLLNLSADRAFNHSGDTIVVSIGDLAAGASSTVTFTASPEFAGMIRSTSTVRSDSFDGAIIDNQQLNALSATGTAPAPADLSIALSATLPDNDGNVVLTVSLNNAGPGIASGIGVSIALPDGVSLVSQSSVQGTYDANTGVWTVGNMRDNLTRSLQLVVAADIGDTVINAEVVSVFETDPDSTPNDGEGDDFASALVEFPGGVNLIGTPNDDVLTGDSHSNAIDGLGGNDVIRGGGGNDRITTGDGRDVVIGTPADLFGDSIVDLSESDSIVIEGLHVPRNAIALETSPNALALDIDDDGVDDGRILLGSNLAGGTFMAVDVGANTHITFEKFFPILGESQPAAAATVNGVANQNFLLGNGSSGFRVTLDSDAVARQHNTLGVYEVDAEGDIVDVRILFDDVIAAGSGIADVNDVEAGHTLGFFIVADGASWARTVDDDDLLAFVDGTGGAGNVSDGAALRLAVNGAAADVIVFHSYAAAMNDDLVEHVLSGVVQSGEAMVFGFEDLVGGGDRDYQDVLFRVDEWLLV